jgi:hypothetical protein
MATPDDGGGTARPLYGDEVRGEERWPIPDAVLFVGASSLALWTLIIALLWRLLG